MRRFPGSTMFGFLASVAGVVLLTAAIATDALAAAPNGRISDAVRAKVLESGRARVIVQLQLDEAYQPEGRLFSFRAGQQRRAIRAKQRRLLARLRGSHRLVHEFRSVPFVALDVDAAALAELEASGLDVARVIEDRLLRPSLRETIPIVEAGVARWFGYDGAGTAIAILDSGVDKTHSFFGGRVVAEACFASSEDGSPGDCPNGQATMIGNDAGVPCNFDPLACGHGTHVAGIAAGSGTEFSGVAPGADLIAIQVFHSSTNCIPLLESNPCARGFASDIAAALEHVYLNLLGTHNVAAVNLSLGGGTYFGTCDGEEPQLTAVIDNLRAAGVATVAASGNDGSASAIGLPACIDSAIAVGSTNDFDAVSFFSNASPEIDLLAPGEAVESSLPGETFFSFDGTSMATPHVAGAFAILRANDPNASVDDLLNLLSTTGQPVTDNRAFPPLTRPRIRIGTALELEYPTPVLDSISPTVAQAWGPGFTLTATGSDLVPDSRIQIDGTDVTTTHVDEFTLTAAFTEFDMRTGDPSWEVTIFTPTPGGGSSIPITLDLLQPTLDTTVTSVMPGDPISVTLTEGPGGQTDYISLAEVGSSDFSFVEFVHMNGATTMTWQTTAPTTPGDYEFRFYPDNGFVRATTSSTFTVLTPPPPVLSVDTTSAAPGEQVTVNLTDGPGGVGDWIALAAVGAAPHSYVAYYSIPNGQTTASWTATMPSTAGDYEFRLFPNNSYNLAATSDTVTVGGSTGTPTLTVDTTAAAPGEQVTVNLTDGPGGVGDWIALAAVGAPTSNYVAFYSIPNGQTTASWTATMPSTEGDYEFRLFPNNTYNLAATSPTVTVGGGPELTVDRTSAAPGEQVTVTLADGPGGTQDWIALAAVGSSTSSYVAFYYIPNGATTANWTVAMPSTAGDYEFRLFPNNSYNLAATSAPVTVSATGGATLAVDRTSAAPGEQITVTLTGGPGGTSDWISFAAVGSSTSTYVAYYTVPSGQTTATWTVNAPSTTGDYEFRLFPNNSYNLAATSDTVTVSGGPELTVDLTSAAPGEQVTVTLTGGPGGVQDWISLAAVGSAPSSYVAYYYIPNGDTSATWTVAMPSTEGDYEFRLLPNNGYTVTETSEPVTVTAVGSGLALTVDRTSAAPGEQVTVTLTDGPGGTGDWIALAAVGSATSSYVAYYTVPSGQSSATWTATMPSTEGDYEFRLFPNGSYNLAATSEAVTVGGGPALTVDRTSAAPGEQVTVTLTGGPGGSSDWIALATVGSSNFSYITYYYVPNGSTTASWTVTMPSTEGDYEFRLFPNNSYNLAATSATVTVQSASAQSGTVYYALSNPIDGDAVIRPG